MGKYMRKAKISADVAVMEVSQATLGVRTRARTLALQRLQSSPSVPAPPTSANVSSDSSCYLQLRSRRLEKPSNLKPRAEKPSSGNDYSHSESEIKPNPRSSSNVRVDSLENSGSITRTKKEDGCFESRIVDEIGQDHDFGVEASFGENSLGFEHRESRSTRESTPCSLIRDVDVATPGSSTRQKAVSAGNRRNRSAILENIPSAAEIEEFFARADQQQQRQFIERYNFDIVNDVPLQGRYKWVRVKP